MDGGSGIEEVALCALDDIADGGSAAFEGRIGGQRQGLMAVRRGDRVWVYVNRCPHVGLPLDFKPGRFLNLEKTHILCTNHGALFRIEDGFCIAGPCTGGRLQATAAHVRGGTVYIAA